MDTQRWTDLDHAYAAWLRAAAEAVPLERLRAAGKIDNRTKSGNAEVVRMVRRRLRVGPAIDAPLPTFWTGGDKDRDGTTFKEWVEGRSDSSRPVQPEDERVRAAVKAVVGGLLGPAVTAPHGVPATVADLTFMQVYDKLIAERAALKPTRGHEFGAGNARRHQDRRTDEVWSLTGVKPALVAEIDPVTELGLGSSLLDNTFPPYLPRAADERLAASLLAAETGLTVVVGAPKSGKTRSVYEIALRDLPDCLCWWLQPTPGTLPKLVDAFDATTRARSRNGTRPGLIVLDDADWHGIGPDGLTEPRLRALAAATRVVVILHREPLAGWRGRITGVDGFYAGTTGPVAAHAGLVAMLELHRVDYDTELTDPHERRALHEYVSRLPPASTETPWAVDDFVRLAERFGAVGQLRATAEHIMTSGGVRAAILQAAMDARIIGPAGSSFEVLRDLARMHYRRIDPNKPSGAFERLFDDSVAAFTDGVAPGSPHALLVRVGESSDTGVELYRLYDALGMPAPQRDTSHLLTFPGLTPEHLDIVGLWHYDNGDLERARLFWTTATDRGSVDAWYWLGVLAETAGDSDTALFSFEKAASAGHTDAMNDAGVQRSKAGDVDAARYWYEMAADAGNTAAMFNLGTDHRLAGELDVARNWYEMAADTGNLDAQRSLGLMAEEAGDTATAVEWFRRAAAGGHPLAMLNFAVHVDPRHVDVAALWQQARDAGVVDALKGLLDGATPEMTRVIAAMMEAFEKR